MWILWQYGRTGRKLLGAAVVAAVAVVFTAAAVDTVSFRDYFGIVDSDRIAPAVAAVAKHPRT
jgi:hypothetical protein